MRLIDAEVLANWIDGSQRLDTEHDYEEVARYIDECPTVDAVPVCRCEDCKFGTNDPTGIVICRMASYPNYAARDPNWYCADGKRKRGDE